MSPPNHLQIRMMPVERAQMTALAASMGLSMSAWCRMHLLAALKASKA